MVHPWSSADWNTHNNVTLQKLQIHVQKIIQITQACKYDGLLKDNVYFLFTAL